MRLAILFVLLSSTAFAQISQRTIVVQGRAQTRVKPDMVRIAFNVDKSDTSQARAMASINGQIDELTTLLQRQGLTKDMIRIAEYGIQMNESDEYDQVQKRDAGNKKYIYRVYNNLTATLRLNGKHVNEILKGIEANRMNGVEVSFDFYLSDSLKKAARIRLTQQALMDAKAAATEMCKGLNVELKNVVQASKNGISFYRLNEPTDILKFIRPQEIETAKGIIYDSAFASYDAEDEELTEEVVVVYEIGER